MRGGIYGGYDMKLFEARFDEGKNLYTVWFELAEGEDIMNDAGICDVLRSFHLRPGTHIDVSDSGWYIRYSFPRRTKKERVIAVVNAVEALTPICF